MNNFWIAKITGWFEHNCTAERVMYVAQMSSKSAKITCSNCHKTYFYRYVPLESFTDGQKKFLEELKTEIDENKSSVV